VIEHAQVNFGLKEITQRRPYLTALMQRKTMGGQDRYIHVAIGMRTPGELRAKQHDQPEIMLARDRFEFLG